MHGSIHDAVDDPVDDSSDDVGKAIGDPRLIANQCRIGESAGRVHMEKRSAGSLAAVVGAVLVVVAIFYPTWFESTERTAERSYYRGRPATIGPRNGDAEGRMGTGGRAVSIMALAAVPLCLAVAAAGLRRRVPFLLGALAGVAAGGFGLMTIVLRADMGESGRDSYSIGAGFVIALLGAVIGAVGSAMGVVLMLPASSSATASSAEGA